MNRVMWLGVLGTALFACGLFLVYGTIDWVYWNDENIMLRDVLISPGFAMMGAGLYIILRFIVFRRH